MIYRNPCRLNSTRPAFTLAELLIALTMASLVCVIATAILIRQHRTYNELNTTLSSNAATRDAVAILSTALRSTARSDTLLTFSDTAVQLNVMTGASTLCTPTLDNHFRLVPQSTSDPSILTSWLSTPSPDDILLAYHDSTTSDPSSGWISLQVATVSTYPPTNCNPVTPPILNAVAYDITTQSPTPIPLPQGTPLRFIKPTRYNIYRASDSHWYLGVRQCNSTGSICTTVQPISGSYGKTSPLHSRSNTSITWEMNFSLPPI